MDTAVAPVSLKGTRDGLELIVAAGFLDCFGGPIAGTISNAGLAFGLRELRKVEAAPVMGSWLVYGEIAAWCACAMFPVTYLWPSAGIVASVANLFAWFSTASALRLLAQAPESASLVRWFSIMRWVLLAPFVVLPILFTLFSDSLKQRAAPAGVVILLGPPIVMAILALQMRSAARPYNKRVRKVST